MVLRQIPAALTGALVLASALAIGAEPRQSTAKAPPDPKKGLTAVDGLLVGHHTLTERPTGCTVVLAPGDGAVAGVWVGGGAPGTRDIELLDPSNSVPKVNAIVLSGGSAFGLDSASGVMKFLDEKKVGFPTRAGKVPIVPSAILYDLAFGSKPEIRPGADCGYQAASGATAKAVEEGNVGAGAGATVGKLNDMPNAMKGGIGSSAIVMRDGLVVAAIVAVNAVGDVVDPATGKIVAGARAKNGKGFADARTLIRAGAAYPPRPGENTTIGIVATNAALTKAQARKMAQMAHDGLARAIVPSHTPADGDTVFALATGTRAGDADLMRIGALAADAMAEAIVRGVLAAKTSGGVPGASDLAAAASPGAAAPRKP
jgi:L-aminopeptidase/D-esterase-like protein